VEPSTHLKAIEITVNGETWVRAKEGKEKTAFDNPAKMLIPEEDNWVFEMKSETVKHLKLNIKLPQKVCLRTF
jgi:hypothetical protein